MSSIPKSWQMSSIGSVEEIDWSIPFSNTSIEAVAETKDNQELVEDDQQDGDWSQWDPPRPPTPEIIENWEETSRQADLDWFKQSASRRLRNLAEQGILVSPDERQRLIEEEQQEDEKEALARGIALRNERHQRTILISKKKDLRLVLDRLVALDHTKPQVIIDCEGLNITRTGTIDIMELFVRPDDTLYLIDIVALKKSAWSTTATCSDFSLRSFLTSNNHKKIMWDLRVDAHVLKTLYNIQLAGIIDASLWAIAYRVHRESRYDGYRISIETACKELISHKIDPAELACMVAAKDARSNLPPRPWAIRPLPVTLIDYASDVKYMGLVYDTVRRNLKDNKDLVADIKYYTKQDLAISSDPYYAAFGEREPMSPWSSNYIKNAWQVLQLEREDAAERARLIARLRRCCSRIMRTIRTIPKLPRMMLTSALRPLRRRGYLIVPTTYEPANQVETSKQAETVASNEEWRFGEVSLHDSNFDQHEIENYSEWSYSEKGFEKEKEFEGNDLSEDDGTRIIWASGWELISKSDES